MPLRPADYDALVSEQGWERLSGARWRHRLPRRGPYDREQMLLELARGKRVVHVGFVDEHRLEAKLAEGTWLHARLAEVAASLVGLDVEEEGVRWAREHGFDAQSVDAQSPEAVAALGLEPAEVVIAGEVVEHLDAPGPFLRAMRELASLDGLLVVTTPNAYRLLNFLAPLAGVELVHPDHTAWHSPHTLATLLARSGWELEGAAYYQNPAPRLGGVSGAAVRAGRALFVRFGRLAPYWSDGLVVWARPAAEG
ncbi:MAG TPA: methyltransferase domain-containing protein [Gaiellaceae bacterium]|nr:methyltransferase domain-containing protein [Gaiellaceae bacterium]